MAIERLFGATAGKDNAVIQRLDELTRELDLLKAQHKASQGR